MENSKDLKIRLIKNKKESDFIIKLREKVFIKCQKVPREREQDGLEKQAKRFIVLYKNKPIGCGRVRFIKNKARLERLIIAKQHRNKHFGATLVQYRRNYAKKKKP
jgi:predicted GNAT family N-acyltransferase